MYDDCLDGSTVGTYCTATNSGKCKTSYFAYQPENSTSVAGGVHRSCSSYEPLEAGFRLKLLSDWPTNRFSNINLWALRWNHYKDEDESILDTRAEPIKVTNSYSTGSTSGGGGASGVSVGGDGGGSAISPGGLQSSMASNAGYPMLKCYSCHAQWTLDSSNDCVKIKTRNPRTAPSFIPNSS